MDFLHRPRVPPHVCEQSGDEPAPLARPAAAVADGPAAETAATSRGRDAAGRSAEPAAAGRVRGRGRADEGKEVPRSDAAVGGIAGREREKGDERKESSGGSGGGAQVPAADAPGGPQTADLRAGDRPLEQTHLHGVGRPQREGVVGGHRAAVRDAAGAHGGHHGHVHLRRQPHPGGGLQRLPRHRVDAE